MNHHRRIILLGPQPEYQSLKTAIERLGIHEGPLALVTAGWQEDEPEDHQLRSALGRDVINLRLFERSDQLFAGDKDLIKQLQDRQDELRHLRDAYRLRLDYLLEAAREIWKRHDPLIDLEPEREAAIEMVRMLDSQYFIRTSQVCDYYEEQMQVAERPLVVKHRRVLEDMLSQCKGLIISGGHAAIILNRLKIFGILELEPEMPIVAWSGAAMALAEQIVFFHDSPPQGPGNPELLRAGMGLIDNVLPLPNAKVRLRLEDQARVALFAKRFERYKCVVFDENTILDRQNGRWWVSDEVVRLGDRGRLLAVGA